MEKTSMMKFLRKHWIWFAAAGIVILFFFTRLYNILALPIFTDEAIYVRWAQIAGDDAFWRFIPLTDGKQPLYVWIAMVPMKVMEDPLLAGRLVSVMAGFGTLLGVFFLTREVFKDQKIAFVASFLYIVYPFSLLYDRLALYDSLVAMLTVWALYFEILLVRYRRLDLAFILGLVIGGGLLTKSSALFYIYLLPFSLLLFRFKQKHWKKQLLLWVLFASIAVILAQLYSGILRLSPFYHMITLKNTVFIYTFSEWMREPFAHLWGNTQGLVRWLGTYFSYLWLVFAGLAFFLEKKYTREKLLLLAWFIVPFAALVVFGKVLYPRYILFMTIPLLVLTAYGLVVWLRLLRAAPVMKVLFCLIFFFFPVISSYYILTDFRKAPIPHEDKVQYFVSWPSGVGVRETVAYLQEQSKDKKIYVGTAGTFGLMPHALEIYLKDNPNVTVKGLWPIEQTMPEELVVASTKMPTYVVFYQSCVPCTGIGKAPSQWPLKKVFQIEKEEKGNFYTLYQVQK